MNNVKLIDFENHFFIREIYDYLDGRTDYPLYNAETDMVSWVEGIDTPTKFLNMALDTIDERVKLMDENHMQAAILSCEPNLYGINDVKASAEFCRKANDFLYEVIKKYPGRFYGSAIVPTEDVVLACEELERCVKEYGYVSLHVDSNFGDKHIDDEEYLPLLAKAEELGVYVYIHPRSASIDRLIDLGFTLAGPGLGYTIDVQRTIMRLIGLGVLDKLPNLKVMLGHLGEALPFLLERIDNRMIVIQNDKLLNKHPASYYFKKNIWVTTSGNMSIPAFQCAKEVLGIDRILFASDYPYEGMTEMVEFVDSIPLSDEEREKMYHKNAESLLGL